MRDRPATTLVGAMRINSADVRGMSFATQLLNGYSTETVDKFMGTVARELDTLWEELEQARTAATQAQARAQQEHANAMQVHAQAQATVQQAGAGESLKMLRLAQQNADAVEAAARADAEQLVSRARNQADSIVKAARKQASEEHAKMLADATAEARRLTARYLQLAERVRHGLGNGLTQLTEQLGIWADMAGPAVAGMADDEDTETDAPAQEPAAEETGPEVKPPAQRKRRPAHAASPE
jgi:DivIVA domain-containing protein